MQPPEDIRHLQQNMMHGGERAFKAVPLFLKNVITEEQWKHCSDREGNPFTSFEAFVAAPLWEGLESSLDDLRVFCRKNDDVRQLIDAAVGVMPLPGGDRRSVNVQSDNITLKPQRGTNPTYALKRLKRDNPELADKVVRGELSAHAAAIAAGFRKKLTPFETIEKLIPKLTADERNTLRSML
jgi:hypothetical protein